MEWMLNFINKKYMKHIESPIVAYNYFISRIQEEIIQLYFDKKTAKSIIASDFIFDNNSFILFKFIKIFNENNSLQIKFLKAISQKETYLVQKTIENFNELNIIFNKYLYLINSSNKNMDDTISQNLIDDIENKIKSRNISYDEFFIVPIDKKLNNNYCFCNDGLLKNLAKRQAVIIRFTPKTNDCFEYKLQLVFENELSQLHGLRNCKPENIETLQCKTLQNANAANFLINLFYYGNII